MSDEKLLAAKQKRADELEAGNERSYEELRKVIPKLTMNTEDLRRELFYTKLVEWGIVSKDQWLDFEIRFHTEVEAKLDEVWAEVREAQKKPQLSVVKKATPKLLGADGRPVKIANPFEKPHE